MNGSDRRGWTMLFFLPLVFFAAEWVLRAHGTPYWLWFNTDNYLYMLGGLHILDGAPPAAFQHPGITLQMMVALDIWLSGGGTPGALSDAAFLQSEEIMTAVNTAMLALDAGALWLLGWVAWRRCGALTPALLAQTAPFLSMLTLKFGIEVEPEPLLLFAVLVLGAAMIEESAQPRGGALWVMGFAVAFGVASKVTFAPLGLAPLILIGSWPRRWAYLWRTALIFVVLMLPEARNLGPMWAWFSGVAAGSGGYGTGPRTVIDFARYPHDFIKLFFARTIFFLVFFASVAALIWLRRAAGSAGEAGQSIPSGKATPAGRGLLAIAVAQLAQVALVAKHPSGHYVLPALELSGPALAFLWLALSAMPRFSPGRASPWFGRAFAVVLALILGFQSFAFARQDREMRRESAGAKSIDMARDFPSCAHVYYFMASSPSQAWFYNSSYSGNRYAMRLKALLPTNEYFSVPWEDGLRDWDGKVEPAALLQRYKCIALRSADPFGADGLAALFGHAFDKAARCQAGSETILVEGARCPGIKP